MSRGKAQPVVEARLVPVSEKNGQRSEAHTGTSSNIDVTFKERLGRRSLRAGMLETGRIKAFIVS